MRCLINWARRHNGMAPVRDHAELDRSAAIRGNDIRRCGDFSHTPCGQSFLQVFTAVHYLAGTNTVGENLAWGQSRLGSARATMSGWLASPAHRQILFTADWRDLGPLTLQVETALRPTERLALGGAVRPPHDGTGPVVEHPSRQ
jgi:uncharacterized protein YkwD